MYCNFFFLIYMSSLSYGFINLRFFEYFLPHQNIHSTIKRYRDGYAWKKF